MKPLIYLSKFCLLTFLAVNLLIVSCLFITPVRAENINFPEISRNSEQNIYILPPDDEWWEGTLSGTEPPNINHKAHTHIESLWNIESPDPKFWNDCTLSPTEVSEMDEIKAKIKGSLSPDEFNEFKKYQPECQRANLIYTKKVWEEISRAAKTI